MYFKTISEPCELGEIQCKVCNNKSCNCILLSSVIFPRISYPLILENNCLTHQFFFNIKELFLGTWNMDVTPSCTDWVLYSLLGVTVRKKWALAQNSWFIDLKLNRNCCNRWESYCSLTHTKWASSWWFPKPRCICSVAATEHSPAGTWSCRAPLTPSWAKLSANLSAGFLPAKLETPSWNGSATGKTRPLFPHTHPSAECQGTVLEMRKIPGHDYSCRSFPKAFGDKEGESTWPKEVKICSWCGVNETGFLLGWQQMMV